MTFLFSALVKRSCWPQTSSVFQVVGSFFDFTIFQSLIVKLHSRFGLSGVFFYKYWKKVFKNQTKSPHFMMYHIHLLAREELANVEWPTKFTLFNVALNLVVLRSIEKEISVPFKYHIFSTFTVKLSLTAQRFDIPNFISRHWTYHVGREHDVSRGLLAVENGKCSHTYHIS